MLNRRERKVDAQEAVDKRKMERELAKMSPEEIGEKYGEECVEKVVALLNGTLVGHSVIHAWAVEDQIIMYNGLIESFDEQKKRYVVAYWTDDIGYDDATDIEDLKASAMAADLIRLDLIV